MLRELRNQLMCEHQRITKVGFADWLISIGASNGLANRVGEWLKVLRDHADNGTRTMSAWKHDLDRLLPALRLTRASTKATVHSNMAKSSKTRTPPRRPARVLFVRVPEETLAWLDDLAAVRETATGLPVNRSDVVRLLIGEAKKAAMPTESAETLAALSSVSKKPKSKVAKNGSKARHATG